MMKVWVAGVAIDGEAALLNIPDAVLNMVLNTPLEVESVSGGRAIQLPGLHADHSY